MSKGKMVASLARSARHANGANGHRSELDVAATFHGKNILLIGTTGFVGKVALSMLLRRYPNIGKVYALVRPGAGNTADERFFSKVATSPVFDPVREVWQGGFESFMREKVVPIPGDIGRPLCNFTDAQFVEFEQAGGIQVILNSAGLVSFTPSLESALRINTMGARNVLEVARRAKARLVHVSTCYVAGQRDGSVWEDEPVVGYFPRREDLRDRDFDAQAEIADCQKIIDQVRERASDRAHISLFRERAAKSLEEQRRDPDDEDALKLTVARERKMWMNEQLTRLGQERAEHWGWTNTYTYTKSLGEQIILADQEVVSTVVRPAVVESSVGYPFPGWNEGFNTTAPLVYLMLKGHRQIVAHHRPLDLIPVDFVAAGMLLACAAILDGSHDPVYGLCASDVNPVTSWRLTSLTGLAVRRYHRDNDDKLKARFEGMAVSYEQFEKSSAPLMRRLAKRATKLIDDKLPTWGAPRLQALAERAKEELANVERLTTQVIDLVEMFKPFNHDFDITFRADNTRALWARCTPADRQALLWAPETIDWRTYWLDVHFAGLKKWVFPVLDDEFGVKPRSVYTYRDLLELFDATTKLNRHRVALRLLPKGGEGSPQHGEPVTYTYERVQDMAQQGAAQLRQRGVAGGDRVMLMSENRPEWGISYFAILKAGATAVPVDAQLSVAEVRNLLKASGARTMIVSDKQRERLVEEASAEDLAAHLAEQGLAVGVIGFDDLLVEPEVSPGAIAPVVRGDTLASIIFTSGTTAAPKGVMLSHKNFTSMASKLSAMFKLYRHDGLLSVLPLHHTFEFSAGFLMPLVHGSSITYLEEVDADALSDAFDEGNITTMVGVPALWQLLHRKIYKAFSERGPLVERAFESLVDANRSLSDKLPWGLDLGKLLFFPVHRKLGGRMRYLISGGSALPPDVMKSFTGLGFKLLEGYGMTESAPVLTVTRPGDDVIPGSVGRALPGIDVRIEDPDASGVGEVVAKGPNVMVGYYQNPEATAEVIKDGWLHTGDLGRIDADGNLYIVGRKKEMILGASGENVYPDELEELYGDSPWVKEISIVGLPVGKAEDRGETVAALVVPDYEHDKVSREVAREEVREHLRKVSKQLPQYKRVKTFHLWDHDLPRTSTRKVKRREVIKEIERLERAAKGGSEARKLALAAASSTESTASGDGAWVRDIVASVSQKKRSGIAAETRMDELGFDSLMLTELGVALEAAGVVLPDPGELSSIETIGDLERFVARIGGAQARVMKAEKVTREKKDDAKKSDDIEVPSALVKLGRRVLRLGQRGLYERVLHSAVHGATYVPPFGGYIVAANHSSHLDMGLVKHALGEQGEALVALAAKDYFFEDPVRRMYFENFTNLVPMERHGSLRESLRLASEVIRQGYILLIFPEGTRSDTGVMIDFKPSLGYLALTNRCGILPMYLAGTHDALPKGAALPKERDVAAHIGPYLPYERLVEMTAGKTRAESYRSLSTHVEGIVRRLAPREYQWTLGEAGRAPVAEYLAARGMAAPGEGEPEGDGASGKATPPEPAREKHEVRP